MPGVGEFERCDGGDGKAVARRPGARTIGEQPELGRQRLQRYRSIDAVAVGFEQRTIVTAKCCHCRSAVGPIAA